MRNLVRTVTVLSALPLLSTVMACADPLTTQASKAVVGAITEPGAAGQTHRARRRSRRLVRARDRHQPGQRPRRTGSPRQVADQPARFRRQPHGQAPAQRRPADRSRVQHSPLQRSRAQRRLGRVRYSSLAMTVAGHPRRGIRPARAARRAVDRRRTARRQKAPRARARSAVTRQSPVSRRRCTRPGSSLRGTASRADRVIRRAIRDRSLTATAWNATS